MLQGLLAQVRFLALLGVGDEEAEALVQAHLGGFDPALEAVPAVLVRDRRQQAQPVLLSLPLREQRHVGRAADELPVRETAEERDLRHRAARPGALPAQGPEALAELLALVLARFLLLLVVRHVEGRAQMAPAQGHDVRPGSPDELPLSPAGRAMVVQVVRADRVQEALGALASQVQAHAGVLAQGPLRQARDRLAAVVARPRIEHPRPGADRSPLRADLDDAAGAQAELRRDEARDDPHGSQREGVEADAELGVETLVDGHPVEHEQDPVVDAAVVHEAVVFGGPARRRRDRGPERVAP